MFNLSGSELIVIALLALVVLGPEKLPGAIRRVGRVYAELKRISTGFETEFRAMIDDTGRPGGTAVRSPEPTAGSSGSSPAAGDPLVDGAAETTADVDDAPDAGPTADREADDGR